MEAKLMIDWGTVKIMFNHQKKKQPYLSDLNK